MPKIEEEMPALEWCEAGTQIAMHDGLGMRCALIGAETTRTIRSGSRLSSEPEEFAWLRIIVSIRKTNGEFVENFGKTFMVFGGEKDCLQSAKKFGEDFVRNGIEPRRGKDRQIKVYS